MGRFIKIPLDDEHKFVYDGHVCSLSKGRGAE